MAVRAVPSIAAKPAVLRFESLVESLVAVSLPVSSYHSHRRPADLEIPV